MIRYKRTRKGGRKGILTIQRVKAEVKKGKTFYRIAKDLGVSESAVWQFAHKHEIPSLRSHSPSRPAVKRALTVQSVQDDINKCKTLYGIAKDYGVNYAVIWRFVRDNKIPYVPRKPGHALAAKGAQPAKPSGEDIARGLDVLAGRMRVEGPQLLEHLRRAQDAENMKGVVQEHRARPGVAPQPRRPADTIRIALNLMADGTGVNIDKLREVIQRMTKGEIAASLSAVEDAKRRVEQRSAVKGAPRFDKIAPEEAKEREARIELLRKMLSEKGRG